MAGEDVRMKNNSNLKIAIFRGVENFKVKKFQPPIVAPFVNVNSTNAFLFRFVGQNEQVTFAFALFNDGVDISGGTGDSPVITVSEQIRYLKDEFYDADAGTDYELWNPNGNVYLSSDVAKGVISAVDFDLKTASQTLTTGSLTFQLGRLGKT